MCPHASEPLIATVAAPARLLMHCFGTTESFEHSPGRWKPADLCVIGPNHRWVQVWLPSSNGLEARLLPRCALIFAPLPSCSAIDHRRVTSPSLTVSIRASIFHCCPIPNHMLRSCSRADDAASMAFEGARLRVCISPSLPRPTRPSSTRVCLRLDS